MKSLQKISINAGNAIFVIVDMENEFCKPGGAAYARNPETCAQVMPGVITAIRGLEDRVRAGGIPIVYIQSVRTHKEPEFTVFNHPPSLKLGTWNVEIVEELKPRKEDTVVRKFSHDPFYNTELDNVLKRLVPDPTSYYAVLTGGAINVCLYHSMLGFHLRNYWTVVPLDCAYYTQHENREIALRHISIGSGYLNVFFSRSDLIEVSAVRAPGRPTLVPGT